MSIFVDISKEFVQIPPIDESYLAAKALKASKNLKNTRKPSVIKVFEPITYITPNDVVVENYWRKPVALFNPGAILKNKKLLVFPRTIFDYYNYVSSIGLFELDIEDLLSRALGKPIRMRIIMSPRYIWELGRGTEDPRVVECEEKFRILYTAVARGLRGIHPLQGFAELGKDLSEISRKFLRLRVDEGYYVPISWKDSALLDPCTSKGFILTRPTLRYGDSYAEVSWRGFADLEKGYVDSETLEPLLTPEEWEYKTGWSTNALQISSNEYVIGWHSVLKGLVYVNGLALISKDGELLAVSDYLLVPERIEELYGDVPGVIFGCGLIKYKEKLLWIGGAADTVIGIYVTELEKALEALRPLKKY